MNLALDAQRREDLPLASKLYREVLAAEPENIDALHMLGVIRFVQGELCEAEQLIRYADSLCPAPLPNLQNTLILLRQRIVASDRPTQSLLAIDIDAADSAMTRVEEVHAAQEITLPALAMESTPDAAEACATPEQQSLFPPIKTFVLENAVVDPESATPATQSIVILDSHLDPARHQSPEWHYGLYRRGAAEGAVERAIAADDFKRPHLPRAVVLTSGYWANWAHFLTEILPKALIADRRAQWRGWPMLISSLALPNARELLRLLVAPERDIIRAGGRMGVDHAGYVSSVGFCPIEYAYDWKSELPRIRPTDCIFSPYALDLVRTAAGRLISARGNGASALLYLRRNSSTRRFINQDEVEQVFRARGFEIVVPEDLSVQQQIELFSRAKVIAGPTGAAIANLVFAPRGGRILVLAAFNRHWPFHYWPNMAHAAGHRVQYLFGRTAGEALHPAHPDLYFDDLSKLGPIIDAAISESGAS